MSNSIFNPELVKIAREAVRRNVEAEKHSFVDPQTATAGGADPMAGAMPPMPGMGGDPMAAGGDPMAAGGDPMAAGGDPMAAGGDPMAADPAAGGGGMTPEDVQAIVQQAIANSGGGMGGDSKPEKPKVDVNTEIYHIKKIMVMIAEEMGLQIPPTMLLGDPAQDPAISQSEAAKDPMSSAASEMPGSAIGGIDPIQGASPALMAGGGGGAAPVSKAASFLETGQSFDSSSLQINNDRASALASQLRRAGAGRTLVGAN